MQRVTRVVLVVIGLIVVLVGLLAWGVEDEYGSGLDFQVAMDSGTWTVHDMSDGKQLMFEGSRSEAQAYMDRARAARENFVVPGVILAIGVALVVIGILLPMWRRHVAPESGPGD